MNLDVNDSEVGQLNVAERIEQHYHADTDAFSPPSLSDMPFAYQTSEATLRKARFWFAVCELVAPEKPLSNLQCHVCGPHGA